MTLERFLEGINLPEEGQQAARSELCTEQEYREFKNLFYHNETAFFAEIEKCEEQEKLLLWLFVRFAVDYYKWFKENGISDEIYFDTFYDFTIWYKVCVKRNGKVGLLEGKWLALSLKGKIFRLGRLQFEPGILKEIYPGEKVLHVHIPEGEPLDSEKCQESFEKAQAFFGKEYSYFDCESWLLAPGLGEILPPDSNIRKFQEMFELRKTTHPFRQAEERVFGFVTEEIGEYPERTVLQRRLKKYIAENGDIGIGYGIRKNRV